MIDLLIALAIHLPWVPAIYYLWRWNRPEWTRPPKTPVSLGGRITYDTDYTGLV